MGTIVQSGRQAAGSSSSSSRPAAVRITPELAQFVRSLTYSTFSDYPLDSLDIPPAAADQKLNSWQETHARLVLQQVPQLQDLRFVLCPKRMDEYVFWTIYFTLCKRYLPAEQAAAAPPPAAAAASGQEAGTNSTAAGSSPAGAGAAAAAAAAGVRGSTDGGLGDAEIAELANDPELDAYLQDALHLDGDAAGAGSVGDGDAGGSDLDDLDDYINKLDAEVSEK
ncbi:hypothetical protein COO60DRAFT_1709439 [Scenedesmus sp. NREL 46B-D3]|nr:hypothetical protein COO60DRAFT_1709439 [Scenedesmus sp. NREL 46B-D3]